MHYLCILMHFSSLTCWMALTSRQGRGLRSRGSGRTSGPSPLERGEGEGRHLVVRMSREVKHPITNVASQDKLLTKNLAGKNRPITQTEEDKSQAIIVKLLIENMVGKSRAVPVTRTKENRSRVVTETKKARDQMVCVLGENLDPVLTTEEESTTLTNECNISMNCSLCVCIMIACVGEQRSNGLID